MCFSKVVVAFLPVINIVLKYVFNICPNLQNKSRQNKGLPAFKMFYLRPSVSSGQLSVRNNDAGKPDSFVRLP